MAQTFSGVTGGNLLFCYAEYLKLAAVSFLALCRLAIQFHCDEQKGRKKGQ
jgi:hypothetical protein